MRVRPSPSGGMLAFMRLLSSGVALALLLSLIPAVAMGHGRFPEAGRVAFHPTDTNVILVRATFGFLATDDDGATWRWICPTVTGARWTEDPAITIASDGSFIIGAFDGLARGVSGGCDWDFPSTDLVDEVVIDVDRTGDASTLYALTSSGGRDNGVFSSGDGGATWTATNAAIDPILFETLRVAPSDASRIYLTGAYPPTAETLRRPFVYASDDSGVTFTSVPFTDFRDGDRNVYLLGVDPTNAQRMFIRVRADADDRVYESVDAGMTFIERLSLPSVDAFAWSDDGATIWIGGRADTGLHRSIDGGTSFTLLRDDIAVGCLGVRGDELFVCADNYVDGYGLGRSSDGGMTFDPLLVFDDIPGIVQCTPGADTIAVCEPELADLAFDLGWVDAGPPPDAGDTGPADTGPGDSGADSAMDAGVDSSADTSTTPPGGGDGCGCATAEASTGAGGWPLPVMILMLGRRWRRRG